MFYNLARRLPPETAHKAALYALKTGLIRYPAVRSERLAMKLWGIDFPNPLGLAAGADKNAQAISGWFNLGFGFVEVGGVTLHPQPGNPRPRLFRLPEDQALINRMGFNNDGVDVVAARLEKWRRGAKGIVGVNVGVNKNSATIPQDYAACVTKLLPLVDFIVINVSSPNTPGLRDWQKTEKLHDLLQICKRSLAEAGAFKHSSRLLVKVAPDIEEGEEQEIASIALECGIDGIVVSNTTLARPETLLSAAKTQSGGLSGGPLFNHSTAQLSRFYKHTDGKIPLVGVGGVDSAQAAFAKICAGASLVQLYTGLVYRGPRLVNQVLTGLDDLLEKEGFSNACGAIGCRAV